MQQIEIREINYTQNTQVLFAKFIDLPHAILLDSCQPHAAGGRYDIMSAAPDVLLKAIQGKTEVQRPNLTTIISADPLSTVQHYLKQYPLIKHHLPFCVGALGFFSYDLNRYYEDIPNIAKADSQLPDMVVGLYSWAIIIDHKLKKAFLTYVTSPWQNAIKLDEILLRLKTPAKMTQDHFQLRTNFTPDINQESYAKAFNTIKEAIYQGDCYQVNFTQRFSANYSGNPWLAYQQLKRVNPASFASFITTESGAILSLSPERFLKVEKNIVETKPIKGTRPRDNNTTIDQQHKNDLLNSEKDKAENLMIVDLMRNDLSRVCKSHSVIVQKLFALESFPAVHHLVSTVSGVLEDQVSNFDLLRVCFPGGSITGTPKIKAMQIIDQLENSRRNIYCGAIGYIDITGRMDSNIAIRTLLCEQGKITCSAGGGIVADSDCDAEYQESWHKVQNLLKALESAYV